MNIFVTHLSPVLAARNLDDRRLSKMVLETAQLLCTAHHICGGSRSKVLYAPTHRNHPCSVWVRASRGNYLWLYRHFAALAAEFESRRGTVHKSWHTLGKILETVPRRIKEVERTPFANCSKYESLEIVEAYRRTMKDKWANDKFPPTWGGRSTPPF